MARPRLCVNCARSSCSTNRTSPSVVSMPPSNTRSEPPPNSHSERSGFMSSSSCADLVNLRMHLDEAAAALGRRTSLSCNGGGGWNHHMACDFVLAELNAGDATPAGLEAIFVEELPPGKAQVMTMPKHHNVTIGNSVRRDSTSCTTPLCSTDPLHLAANTDGAALCRQPSLC